MVFNVLRELCFVPVGFSAGIMSAYEGSQMLVDTIDVDFEGMFLGEEVFVLVGRVLRGWG